MKFDSPLFDRIRVKPSEDRRARPEGPCCDWKGCANAATHRAPKARPRENEHWRFCIEHVREYNHSYNYFAGMSDAAVAQFQKDAITGHRPTWKLGLNGKPLGNGHPLADVPDSQLGVASFDGIYIEADPITDPRTDRVLPVMEEEQIFMCRQMENPTG